MRDDLFLKILSPTKVVFTDVVTSVRVPSYNGEIDIYSKHSSLVSSLLPGYVIVNKNSEKQEKYFINSGYVEINQNNVLLILDDILDISDITKEFLEDKINIFSSNLNDLYDDDFIFNRNSQSLAIYQQILSSLSK